MKVQGVSRMADNPRAVLLSLSKAPTDDDLRSLHEFVRNWSDWPPQMDNAAPIGDIALAKALVAPYGPPFGFLASDEALVLSQSIANLIARIRRESAPQ